MGRGVAVMLGWKRTVLGLDFGRSSLKWVLRRGGLRPALVGQGAMAADGELSQQLAELRTVLVEPPDIVVGAVPGDSIFFQRLDLPFRDLRKLRAVLPFEMEPCLPRSVEGLETDALLHSGGCVGVGLDPERFETFRIAVEEAGLGPVVLEPSILGAARAFSAGLHDEAADGTEVLIDIGHRSIGCAVFYEGELCRLAVVPGGLGHLVSGLSKRLGQLESAVRLRLEEDGLAQWPEATEQFLAHWTWLWLFLEGVAPDGEPIELHFCGGGAMVSGLMLLVKERSGAKEVHRVVRDGLDPLYTAAWGTALRGGDRGAPHALGLLSSEPDGFEIWTPARRRLAALLAVVLLLLGIGDLWWRTSLREERLAGLEREVETLFRSALPGVRRIVNAPHQLQMAVTELEDRLALVRDPASDPLHPLAVLTAVSRAVPSELQVELVSYTQSGDALRIEGEIDSLGALSRLQTALGTLPQVEKIVSGATRRVVGSDRVAFELGLELMVPRGGSP